MSYVTTKGKKDSSLSDLVSPLRSIHLRRKTLLTFGAKKRKIRTLDY
jgi:hypothetical protein